MGAIVARGEAWCAKCGKWIPPGAPWYRAHRRPSGLTGPECRKCNRADGARRGNAQRAQAMRWRRAMYERW